MSLRSPRLPGAGAVVLLVVLVVALLRGCGEQTGERAGGERERAGRERPQEGTLAGVVDIVDGDTIEVELDGRVEDVRYIGVDTPESVAPGQPVECFGVRASEFNAELVSGEQVRLVFDAERRDVYGRLLAYVYVDERFVNALLVREGYARTLTIPPNDSFAGRFARLEQEAGRAGRGLWSECGAYLVPKRTLCGSASLGSRAARARAAVRPPGVVDRISCSRDPETGVKRRSNFGVAF